MSKKKIYEKYFDARGIGVYSSLSNLDIKAVVMRYDIFHMHFLSGREK